MKRPDITLDALIGLIHELNIVHFPHGIEVCRRDGKFRARITKKDETSYEVPGTTCDTAEEAYAALVSHVGEIARKRAESAANEATKSGELFQRHFGST